MSKTKIKLLLMIIIFGAIIIFCNGDVFANVTFDSNHSYSDPDGLSQALKDSGENCDWFLNATYNNLKGGTMDGWRTWERVYSMCWHINAFDPYATGTTRDVQTIIDVKDGLIYINDEKIENSQADALALIKYYLKLKENYGSDSQSADPHSEIREPFIKVFILTLQKYKNKTYAGVFPYQISSYDNAGIKQYFDISNYQLPKQVEAYRIRFLYVDGKEGGGQPYMFTAMKTVTVQPKTGRMRIIKSDSQYSTMRLNGAQFVLYSNDKKKYIGKTNVTSKRLNIYNG